MFVKFFTDLQAFFLHNHQNHHNSIYWDKSNHCWERDKRQNRHVVKFQSLVSCPNIINKMISMVDCKIDRINKPCLINILIEYYCSRLPALLQTKAQSSNKRWHRRLEIIVLGMMPLVQKLIHFQVKHQDRLLLTNRMNTRVNCTIFGFNALYFRLIYVSPLYIHCLFSVSLRWVFDYTKTVYSIMIIACTEGCLDNNWTGKSIKERENHLIFFCSCTITFFPFFIGVWQRSKGNR